MDGPLQLHDSMLAVKIDKYYADLPDDIAIQLKVTNPAFSETGLPEAYSYSWNLSNTPNNTSILRKYKGKNVSVTLSFSGMLILKGIGFVKRSSSGVSIQIREVEYDLKQYINDQSLTTISDLPTIQVYNQGDNINTALTKWVNFVADTMNGLTNYSEMLCFPQISMKAEEEGINKIANLFYNGAYRFGDNLNMDPNIWGDTPWRTSVSPCLRLKFAIKTLLDHLQLNYDFGPLNDIKEFDQLFVFSGIYLDRSVDGPITGRVTNIFQPSFNGNELLPDVPMINLLGTLHDLFGAFFLFDGKKINVRLIRDTLKIKPQDMSRYCDPNFTKDEEGSIVKISFPIDVYERYYLFGYGDKISYYYSRGSIQMQNRSIGSSLNSTEYNYSCVLANSNYGIFDILYGEVENVINTYITQCSVNYEYSSKQLQEETTQIDQIFVGTYRGIHPLWGQFTEDYGAYMNSHIFCSWIEPFWQYDPVRQFIDFKPHEYSLGKYTIYPLESESTYNEFLRPLINHIAYGSIIEKILYLPAHKISEIMQWNNPNHIIKQRNMSFKGTVKQISFTLYKNKISPTVITYSSIDDIEMNPDYNNDFNEDFLTE